MARAPTKPTDQELQTATGVLRWFLDQAGPIRITIEPATGDGRPIARVDRASPDHGRPGKQAPGVAGGEDGASGDAPLDLGAEDKAAAEKARQLLNAFGFHKADRVLKEFGVARIIEVCQQAHKQQAEIRNMPAWINRALWRHWSF